MHSCHALKCCFRDLILLFFLTIDTHFVQPGSPWSLSAVVEVASFRPGDSFYVVWSLRTLKTQGANLVSTNRAAKIEILLQDARALRARSPQHKVNSTISERQGAFFQ